MTANDRKYQEVMDSFSSHAKAHLAKYSFKIYLEDGEKEYTHEMNLTEARAFKQKHLKNEVYTTLMREKNSSYLIEVNI